MKLLVAFTILLLAAFIVPSRADSTPDCAKDEVYKTCGRIGCQPTCAMTLKGTKCIGISRRCGHGCYCKDGYVRLSSQGGRCVPIADCAQYAAQSPADSSS
ncbi:unnamed protein product [Hermetia illucens]|uniref:TIL domain-containing protein n=1 Tax=Hermetia illucens TaxID=343691 RepID=A0A7R8V6B8_HERIL|nr:chymotrypsin inhibitor Ani s 6-like [Hermetia illucens]CAD7093623.1 unnamed protein product [Hermetia illucens]